MKRRPRGVARFLLLLFFGDFQYLVHQAVFNSFGGGQVKIPFCVFADGFHWFAGVVSHDIVQKRAQAQDLLCLDLDVGGLSLGSTQGLMQVDGGIRQGIAAAFCAGCQ
jgi:hypothetical protein